MRRALLALWLLAFSLFPQTAPAQDALVLTTCGVLPLAYKSGAIAHATVDLNGNTCISGSISASTTGFAPGGNFANLTATNVSADVTLPAGAVVAVQNTGTTTVSCNFTVGAGTAVANQNQIPASSTVYITVGGNTHGSCIDQTGSASNLVTFSGGTGLGTGFGGGGGGGGGGAVTIADGADIAEGAKADAVCGTATGTCSVTALLKFLNQATTSSIPAGTNVIGKVGLDGPSSTPITGVSNSSSSALVTNLVAKASAGSVVSISGSGASGSFIMLFDAVSAPADGAVTPKKCWGPLAAAGPFVFGWGPGPVLTMVTGITVVSSSTGCFTKTAVNFPFVSVEFQ